MKKLVLTAVLAGLSSFAMANFYVQGDVAFAKLEAKENGAKIKDSTPSVRFAYGKDTGDVRYQGDYTYFGKLKNSEAEGEYSYQSKAAAHSLGLAAIYDFGDFSGFEPYAGARLGLNYLSLDGQATGPSSFTAVSYDKFNVGAGVLAGVQYKINPQISADLGAEYNYLGKIGDLNAKLSQYGGKVGLRYNF
ncbi:MAG: opacity family porin [Acinetobacter sp.]|nr:opacity family porin [Acinetobacter sp.]